MAAAMLVLEPIFEADLPLELYAYRTGRNAQQAAVGGGRTAVPWPSRSGGRRPRGLLPGPFRTPTFSSRWRAASLIGVLHLIKMWLDCPVEETDERGRKTRTTEARDQRRGIPAGLGPLSLTAGEHHMRRFVLGWKKSWP